jgi:hypothetical protein
MDEWIRIETTAGEPITRGEVEVTPQARALVLRWPSGGFVWSWPLGVTVKKGESVEQLPIRNATRAGIFGAVAGGALLGMVLALLLAPRR